MARSKEIKQIFDLYLAEKNLLNSKFSQKVHIHTIKAEQVQQMFENFCPDSELGNQLPLVNSSKSTSNSNQISTIQGASSNNPIRPSHGHKYFGDCSKSPARSDNKSVTPIKKIGLDVDIKV